MTFQGDKTVRGIIPVFRGDMQHSATHARQLVMFPPAALPYLASNMKLRRKMCTVVMGGICLERDRLQAGLVHGTWVGTLDPIGILDCINIVSLGGTWMVDCPTPLPWSAVLGLYLDRESAPMGR